MPDITITDVLVIKREGQPTIQVAGSEEDILALAAVLKQFPAEQRGQGWIFKLDGDEVYSNSEGKEVLRIPDVALPKVPDVRNHATLV